MFSSTCFYFVVEIELIYQSLFIVLRILNMRRYVSYIKRFDTFFPIMFFFFSDVRRANERRLWHYFERMYSGKTLQAMGRIGVIVIRCLAPKSVLSYNNE